MSDTTVVIENCLDRLKRGELDARDELMSRISHRLLALARRMMRDSPRVGRWEQPEDLMQGAVMRLHSALASIVPQTVEDFLSFAAALMRRELTDMARHYLGPEGMGAHHETPIPGSLMSEGAQLPMVSYDKQSGPYSLSVWSEFHSSIELLPEFERRVFDLLWYHDLTQAEAAKVLNVSERQLRRYWQSARLNLKKLIDRSWDSSQYA
ncbi:RNA polymerase sigma factor [Schlesneria sp. T3-172]|uniref:RNA polymerase sigma factor n=1 Tax=Schlesneria sphaerica TaxID=3373610 RepID=UPI0037CBF2BD